ncbi:histidine phosphatase family protein [Microbacterium stercoris]|uniref:Histidine phosphatase family protein n=1 Tax=Microbacterium stercoris TaxID=2820289 RepID=A0A939QLL1_9MICO|nr:histidine phosphatase family protein [Microbacterium stercoris]MBO3662468.1 histidine phosphatase family protein [Microbacterium stercoris]MBO3664460.1 histidine phosphatase family protein [Microbacterium stercoris]
MTLLALVRHGQTDWNAERRVQGRTDIPLNDIGRAQALTAAENLRGGGWTRIVSSSLGRARETAEIIAGVLGLPAPRAYSGLVERDYGVGEGTLVADLHATYGHGDVPGGETTAELAERVLAAIADVAADTGDEPTVVVAHGGVIRELLRLATAGERPRPGERVENAAVNVFRFDGDHLVLQSADLTTQYA